MIRRDQIRDFRRPTVPRRVARIDIKNMVDIKPLQPKLQPNATIPLSIDIKQSRPRPKPIPVLPRQNKSKVLRRQGLNKLPPFTPRKTKHHIIRWAALSCFVVVFLGVVVASFYHGKKSSGSQADYKGVLSTTDAKIAIPSEVEPAAADKKTYNVPNGFPRFLSSERLEVEARIKEIDITGSNIELPDNIHDVGWYRTGGKPGQGDVTVLTGNISGQSKKGVFGKVSSIVIGDVLTVETGGGKVHNYIVRTIKRYPKGKIDYDELLKSAKQGKEALNIIALESRFDIESQNIEDNYVVFAVKE